MDVYISDSLAAEKLYDDWVNINALHKLWLYDPFGYWLMIEMDELSKAYVTTTQM